MTQAKLVALDPDGTILRGLAVPFGEPALIVADGQLVAEHFDENSITQLPTEIPLLVAHDRDRPPAGIVLQAQQFSRGVGVEARLVGSDPELDGWRRRFEHGLMTALSIGFTASGRQLWDRPIRAGQPPRVTRRGVEIVEISLVNWAAYESAGLTSLNARTAQAQHNHEVAMEMLAEYQARKAQEHRRSERAKIEAEIAVRQAREFLERRRR